MELRNQQLHDEMKMEVANSQAYTANLANFMQNSLLHQPHHMHILNIHSHRSLTNSPISNPGSPGLDMIQEEIQIQSCPKNEPSVSSGYPQISVTDVLGKRYEHILWFFVGTILVTFFNSVRDFLFINRITSELTALSRTLWDTAKSYLNISKINNHSFLFSAEE